MTKTEFEEKAGITVDDLEWKAISEAYKKMSESRHCSEKYFCLMWSNRRAMADEWWVWANAYQTSIQKHNADQAFVSELADVLIGNNEQTSLKLLREKVIKAIGPREYYRRMVERGHSLDNNMPLLLEAFV